MSDTIVNVENLSVDFRSRAGKKVVKALDNVSFTLERGDTLSVVGESGSGKSTLLRALLFLIKPSSGNVALFGERLSDPAVSELNEIRRRCGYVPQDPYGALPPSLSVIDAVIEPEIIAGTEHSEKESRERAASLLAEVGLTGDRILYSRAVGLSGGQRQRVELARALMLSPDLLLCDEPTSMQDASTRGEIIEILRRRTDNGMSMIFVTHDLMLAAFAARKIIVLKEGKVCESGTAREVLSSPKHQYTKALLDALPKI